MSLLDEFFANEFFTLIRETAQGKSAVILKPSQRLAGLGFSVAPALGRLLDFAAVHDAIEIGALAMFSTDDVVPGDVNALAFMLEQPFRVDATLTHALPLGTTGGGDIWLVSLAATRGRHDVFLYGHDTGELEHVADSVEAFAFALHLGARDAAPTAAERRALAGHVANNDDIDLAWLGEERLANTSSPTQPLHERTDDLRGTLNGYGRHLPAPAGELPKEPVPAEALDALLRAFLRVEEQALAALFARFAQSPSGLVRDAVSHLRKLEGPRAPATFEGRVELLLEPAGH
jgi:hypothetical protein